MYLECQQMQNHTFVFTFKETTNILINLNGILMRSMNIFDGTHPFKQCGYSKQWKHHTVDDLIQKFDS